MATEQLGCTPHDSSTRPFSCVCQSELLEPQVDLGKCPVLQVPGMGISSPKWQLAALAALAALASPSMENTKMYRDKRGLAWFLQLEGVTCKTLGFFKAIENPDIARKGLDQGWSSHFLKPIRTEVLKEGQEVRKSHGRLIPCVCCKLHLPWEPLSVSAWAPWQHAEGFTLKSVFLLGSSTSPSYRWLLPGRWSRHAAALTPGRHKSVGIAEAT